MELTNNPIKFEYLNSENLEESILYIENKKELFKKTLCAEEIQQTKNRIKNNLDSKNLRFVIGKYGNNLVCIISFFLWERMPYATVGDLFISIPSNDFKLSRIMILNLVLNKTLDLILENKRHTFFFTTHKRFFSSKQFLTKKNDMHTEHAVSAFNRFNVNIEAVIPKNTRPEYETYWNLIGCRTHSSDLWIRRATLKPEFFNMLICNPTIR